MGGVRKQVFAEDGPKHMMRSGSTGIEVDWDKEEHRRCVTACLVKGTYLMAEHDRTTREENSRSRALAPEWWKSFHFKRRDDYELEVECKCVVCNTRRVFRDRGKRFVYEYGAVFEYAPQGGRHPSAPSFVIAFRGTLPRDRTLFHDMRNNLSILLNRQHLCDRFRHAHDKVGELLQSLSTTIPANNGGGSSRSSAAIWLAGHSLGASVALDVGRDLMSTRGLNLPTFLFNPPHVSLAPVIGEDARRDVYTMGYVGKYLLGKALPRHKNHMDELFRKLSPWVPNLYVHPQDPICKGFIDYFEQRERIQQRHPRLASAASLSYRDMLLGKQRPHLIPSAMVWKNRSQHGDGHGLWQWWEHEGSERLLLSPKRYTWPVAERAGSDYVSLHEMISQPIN